MRVPTNRTNAEYYYNLAIIIQLEVTLVMLLMILGFSPFIGIIHGFLVACGIRKTSRYIRGIDRPMPLRRFIRWYLLCHIPMHFLYCSPAAIPKSHQP